MPHKHAINDEEAWEMLTMGLIFFLRKHTLKTLVVLAILCGGVVYVVMDYVTTTKADVQKAVPIGESVEMSLMPRAYGAETAVGGEPIIIKGKTYGYADPMVKVWKLNYGDVFLVWNMRTDEVVTVRMSTDGDMFKKAK